MSGALIVTAEPSQDDFAWLQSLRSAHYPPERNRVPAHLTMFHALPPSAEGEVRALLARFAGGRAPRASVEGLLNLGGGVAFRVVSEELDRMREELAAALRGLLTAQDSAGWRPHVTIQNKVSPSEAMALKESLERRFIRRPLGIRGLGLHRYLGGPWKRLALYPFRGVR